MLHTDQLITPDHYVYLLLLRHHPPPGAADRQNLADADAGTDHFTARRREEEKKKKKNLDSARYHPLVARCRALLAIGVRGWVVVSCSRDAPPGASAVFRAVLYLSIYLSTL